MAAPTSTLPSARTVAPVRRFSSEFARWPTLGLAALFVVLATVFFFLFASPL